MNYKVINYRYGLPKGTIIKSEDVDESKARFLEKVKQKAVKKVTAEKE